MSSAPINVVGNIVDGLTSIGSKNFEVIEICRLHQFGIV